MYQQQENSFDLEITVIISSKSFILFERTILYYIVKFR